MKPWNVAKRCVVPWGAIAGLVFLCLGLGVNDWECQNCSVPTGGGYDDVTWGTIATDWGLAFVYIPMSIFAPGIGVVRAALCSAAACDAVAWFLAGVAHLIKATTGVFHVPVFIVSVIGTTIGRIMRLFGTLCAMRSVWPCACIQNAKVLAAIFGSFSVAVSVMILLAEIEAIPVKGWIVVAVNQVLMVLLLFIFSTAAILKIRAKAVWAPITAFLMFVLGAIVNLIKPNPFKYSIDFNDNALFHTFFIWEAAASFYALEILAETPARDTTEGVHPESDKHHTAKQHV